MPALPSPPGALSAAQLRAIAQTVRAQRESIGAMQAQLEAFDQQMAVFERILDPLVRVELDLGPPRGGRRATSSGATAATGPDPAQ